MKITEDHKRRAQAMVADELFKAVWAILRERAVNELLQATTTEDRTEAWHRVKAVEDAPRMVLKWAAEAKVATERANS